MKKFLLLGFIAITLLGVYTWFFVYNKQHKDIEAAQANFTTSATSLITEFTAQKDSAQKKYNEKVVQLEGTVLEILGDDSTSSVVLAGNENYTLICEVLNKYNDQAQTLKPQDKIEIKGLFVGFMEADADFGLPGDLRFKKCSITTK